MEIVVTLNGCVTNTTLYNLYCDVTEFVPKLLTGETCRASYVYEKCLKLSFSITQYNYFEAEFKVI